MKFKKSAACNSHIHTEEHLTNTNFYQNLDCAFCTHRIQEFQIKAAQNKSNYTSWMEKKGKTLTTFSTPTQRCLSVHICMYECVRVCVCVFFR